MAAPSVWKVFWKQRVGLCLPIQLESRVQVVASIVQTQVHHKQKSIVRFRDPHSAAVKDKWKKISKTRVLQKDAHLKIPLWTHKPLDDVWIRTFYPTPKYHIEETIMRHKEYADPTMLDNMEGFVYADLELDMTTKKKTKFLKNIVSTVLLPHPFEDDAEKICMVFCKTEEDKETALALGAKFAGGDDIIKKIQDGEIEKNEFHFAMATPDIIGDLVSIRSLLRDRFPTKAKGSLSSSVENMMNFFTNGLSYESSKSEPSEGQLQVPLGRLDMTVTELTENFHVLVKSVCSHRPQNLGPFIKKIQVIAPPSSEKFLLDLTEYVPGYTTGATGHDDGDESEEEEESEMNS